MSKNGKITTIDRTAKTIAIDENFYDYAQSYVTTKGDTKINGVSNIVEKMFGDKYMLNVGDYVEFSYAINPKNSHRFLKFISKVSIGNCID